MTRQMLCLVLLVVAVIAVIVVSVLLVQCHNSKGNTYEPTHFCGTCQGLGQKVCTDRPALNRLYRDNVLTESSHLLRGNQWPVTMPADQFYNVHRNHESYGEMSTSSDPVCDYANKHMGKCMHIDSSISTSIGPN